MEGRRLRIAVGGIATESSTFSPHRTARADFVVTRDVAVLERYPWWTAPEPWRDDVEWVGLLHAGAMPGGPVDAETYRDLRDELLERAGRAGPLDGVLLDIHGAMHVIGLRDAEAELAGALRAAVGPGPLLSASMDLHGNVTEALVRVLDIVTCYRRAPHEDAAESLERAARNLVGWLRDRTDRPRRALVTIPLMLAGETTSTRAEPAKGLYARITDVTALDGVLDAGIWVGYAWADEPRTHAAVVVTGDDEPLIAAEAQRLARAFWEARAGFRFAAPAADLDRCLRVGLASPVRPFFISDTGDNPTAGGAGDVSSTLERLRADPAVVGDERTALYASILDPAAVAAAVSAGPGAEVAVAAGGRIDTSAPPAQLRGVVHAVRRADPAGGDVAVIRAGGLHVILTSRRRPYHRLEDFAALDLDVSTADLVVVKIGYLVSELYAAAADWMLALTPGGVDQDLPRLGHRHVRRPIWPLDREMDDPDLTAVIR